MDDPEIVAMLEDLAQKGEQEFIEEIPECSAFGSTAESALGELDIAFEGWMEAVEKRGYPIPDPRNVFDLGLIKINPAFNWGQTRTNGVCP